MNHFEDQHLPERHELLGVFFEEEAKFFAPAAAQEADFFIPNSRLRSRSIQMIRSACICMKWEQFRS